MSEGVESNNNNPFEKMQEWDKLYRDGKVSTFINGMDATSPMLFDHVHARLAVLNLNSRLLHATSIHRHQWIEKNIAKRKELQSFLAVGNGRVYWSHAIANQGKLPEIYNKAAWYKKLNDICRVYLPAYHDSYIDLKDKAFFDFTIIGGCCDLLVLDLSRGYSFGATAETIFANMLDIPVVVFNPSKKGKQVVKDVSCFIPPFTRNILIDGDDAYDELYKFLEKHYQKFNKGRFNKRLNRWIF